MHDAAQQEDPLQVTDPGVPFRMLLVDDEPRNLEILERLFRDDYEIVMAANGAEALEHARNQEPDVIITDQRMARMTGVEFLSEIVRAFSGEVIHCQRRYGLMD